MCNDPFITAKRAITRLTKTNPSKISVVIFLSRFRDEGPDI